MDKTNSLLAYEEIGTGEPAAILIPGWCCDRGPLTPLAQRLGKTRKSVNLDLLGHGPSGRPPEDFGAEEVLAALINRVEKLGLESLVTVTWAHAGWIAVELRRRLGSRVKGLVFIEWIMSEPPKGFYDVLRKMRKEEAWREARDQLFAGWSAGEAGILTIFTRYMGHYGFDMWARAGREIENSYTLHTSALQVLTTLDPPVPCLSVYSPTQIVGLYGAKDDAFYVEELRRYEERRPWFHFRGLRSRSHMPHWEVTEEVARAIETFITHL